MELTFYTAKIYFNNPFQYEVQSGRINIILNIVHRPIDDSCLPDYQKAKY